MARVDERFQDLIRCFDRSRLDEHPDPVYGMWGDCRLAYLNRAWFDFAHGNDGEPGISEDWGLGASVLEACSVELRPFFETNYRVCLTNRKPWLHEYECSSASLFRKYHQTVYPLGESQGFLVLQSRVVERPHCPKERPECEPDEAAYANENNLITQCCHCRRVRNRVEPSRWDWVPDWVENMPDNLTHGLCKTCMAYFYPRLRSN